MKTWNIKLFPNEEYRKEVEELFLIELMEVVNTNNSSKRRILNLTSKNNEVFTISSHIIKDYEKIIVFLKDITDKQKFDETRADAESELKKLNEKLIEKNKELEQVVYVTSHDLRSPLINILGFSRELQMSNEEINDFFQNIDIPEELAERFKEIIAEELPETAKIISQSAIKMDTLLSALLRLSRSGRGKPNFQKLDMNKIFSEISNEHQSLLNKKEIKLEIGDLENCIADSIQLNQIFSNLIDNAINYSDEKKINRFIKVSSYSGEDNIIYKVADNGIGIKKEHKRNIFELFKRLNEVEVKGEGLGLTIVKKLIDLNNGEVWVESEHGISTTFFIKIPKNNRSDRWYY